MIQKIMNFIKDEDGIELVEYAIMAGMLILIAIAMILTIGGQINEVFEELSTQLQEIPGVSATGT